MTYSEKLLDPRWQKLRLEVFSRDNFKCLCCDATDKTLNVHHLIYSGNPWDSALDTLETLCHDCHQWREGFNEFAGGRTLVSTRLCHGFMHFAGYAFKPSVMKKSNVKKDFKSFIHFCTFILPEKVKLMPDGSLEIPPEKEPQPALDAL